MCGEGAGTGCARGSSLQPEPPSPPRRVSAAGALSERYKRGAPPRAAPPIGPRAAASRGLGSPPVRQPPPPGIGCLEAGRRLTGESRPRPGGGGSGARDSAGAARAPAPPEWRCGPAGPVAGERGHLSPRPSCLASAPTSMEGQRRNFPRRAGRGPRGSFITQCPLPSDLAQPSRASLHLPARPPGDAPRTWFRYRKELGPTCQRAGRCVTTPGLSRARSAALTSRPRGTDRRPRDPLLDWLPRHTQASPR